MVGNIRNVLLLTMMIFGVCLEVVVVTEIHDLMGWGVLAIASLTPVLITSTFTAIIQSLWRVR